MDRATITKIIPALVAKRRRELSQQLVPHIEAEEAARAEIERLQSEFSTFDVTPGMSQEQIAAAQAEKIRIKQELRPFDESYRQAQADALPLRNEMQAAETDIGKIELLIAALPDLQTPEQQQALLDEDKAAKIAELQAKIAELQGE